MQILIGLESSCKIDEIVATHRGSWTVPEPDATELIEAAFNYAAIANALGGHFAAKSQRLFNVTHKQRVICEIALASRYLNPTLASCYINEDYMCYCRRLVRAASPGTKSWMVSSKVVEMAARHKHMATSSSDQWYRP